MRHLWQRSAGAWACSRPGLILHGRHVKALDGSTFKTPDTVEKLDHFSKPGAIREQAAYPQMRAALLVDIGARLVEAERHAPYPYHQGEAGPRP